MIRDPPGKIRGRAEALSGKNEAQEPEAEPEEFKAISAVDWLTTIAIASCEKAMAEGVVEKSSDPTGYTLVMAPKPRRLTATAKHACSRLTPMS